jgi:hypothetical protein
LLLAIAACHSAPRSTSGTAPGSSALAAASAAAPRVPDGCDLIRQRDLEELLVAPLEPLRLRAGICETRRAGEGATATSNPMLGVRLYPSITSEAFDAETERSARLFEVTRSPLAGLGDAAFRSGDVAISVHAHGAGFAILRGDPAIDERTVQTIATQALVHLGELPKP